jgi:excisionase family DNA binding protein
VNDRDNQSADAPTLRATADLSEHEQGNVIPRLDAKACAAFRSDIAPRGVTELSGQDTSGGQGGGPSRPRSTVVRLALSPDEAAAALGISRDHFDKHVQHELRVVRRGRRRLVPVRELERWLDREAAIPLKDDV